MWRYISMGVLTMCAGAATAQVFECTNARGVKEFAQFCPPGTVQQRQIGKSGVSIGGDAAVPAPVPADAAAGAVPAAPKPVDAEAEFRKRMNERQEAEAKAAKEKAQAEEGEQNCLQARAQLQALQDGQRISRFDPATGERIVLGDDDRTEEIARQQSTVDRWCKK
jgi:hypothetical protein